MTGIYKITNKLNNKVYIGQSNNIERRYKEHFNCKQPKQKIDQAIQVDGKQNFSFEIIEECDETNLTEREKYWIQYYDSFDNGYNMTKGGQNEYCGNPILTKDDVINIRIAYNNHEKRDDIYELYADKITKDGFYHIWDGSRWQNIMPEVYTEENKLFHKQRGQFSAGGQHPFAKLTDEEVINIRTRYITETASQIWQDYKEQYTLGSFK